MTDTTASAADPSAAPPRTMRVWNQSRYGGPDAVVAATAPVPAPKAGEVLLRVRATGLNNGDMRVMRGEPLLVRLFFGLRRPRVAVRGMDVAGTVVARGPGVVDLAVGDEVVGELPGGGLAEWAVAPVARLVARPAAVSPETAAALPVAGGTAWQALAAGGVADGQRVLVIGASGGVGTFAVQLATGRGAEVWALTGERSRELVESLGATRTFDYRATGIEEFAAASFDVVICIESASPLRSLQRLVRDGGTLVMVSGSGGRVLGPIGRIIRGGLLSIGSRRPVRALAATAKPEVLEELLELVARGRLTPVIEQTWPLSEADRAIAHVDAGHTLGKVVVHAE